MRDEERRSLIRHKVCQQELRDLVSHFPRPVGTSDPTPVLSLSLGYYICPGVPYFYFRRTTDLFCKSETLPDMYIV